MKYILIIIGVVMQKNCLDAFVIGGNKHFPDGVHYPGANYLGVHISTQYYSAGQ